MLNWSEGVCTKKVTTVSYFFSVAMVRRDRRPHCDR